MRYLTFALLFLYAWPAISDSPRQENVTKVFTSMEQSDPARYQTLMEMARKRDPRLQAIPPGLQVTASPGEIFHQIPFLLQRDGAQVTARMGQETLARAIDKLRHSAYVINAGGLASRMSEELVRTYPEAVAKMGGSVPKGLVSMTDGEPLGTRTFLEYHMKHIRKIELLFGISVPVIIYVGPESHDLVLRFLEERRWFGHKAWTFVNGYQETLPGLNPETRLVDPEAPVSGPGHGEAPRALVEGGAFDWAIRKGVRYFAFNNIEGLATNFGPRLASLIPDDLRFDYVSLLVRKEDGDTGGGVYRTGSRDILLERNESEYFNTGFIWTSAELVHRFALAGAPVMIEEDKFYINKKGEKVTVVRFKSNLGAITWDDGNPYTQEGEGIGRIYAIGERLSQGGTISSYKHMKSLPQIRTNGRLARDNYNVYFTQLVNLLTEYGMLGDVPLPVAPCILPFEAVAGHR